jgi:HlyD family secretion protein
MFRVKARLVRQLLKRHRSQVKTGVSGVAYLRLDSQIEWLENLAIKVPQ